MAHVLFEIIGAIFITIVLMALMFYLYSIWTSTPPKHVSNCQFHWRPPWYQVPRGILSVQIYTGFRGICVRFFSLQPLHQSRENIGVQRILLMWDDAFNGLYNCIWLHLMIHRGVVFARFVTFRGFYHNHCWVSFTYAFLFQYSKTKSYPTTK